MNKPKVVISSAYAAIITIVFVVVITIWAEFSTPLKDWLKDFSGHHWTSKSIFSVLLYAISTIGIYMLPHKKIDVRIQKSLRLLMLCTLLGVIAITLFFAGHHFEIF